MNLISPKLSLTHLVSVGTSRSQLRFKLKFGAFEQGLAAQHEFVETEGGYVRVYDC